MLKIHTYRSTFALIIALFVNTGNCIAATKNTGLSMLNDTAANSATTTTFCIGRFLIDVPEGSSLSGGNYKYDRIALEPVKTSTIEEFEKVVAARELKLRSTTNERTNQSMLLQSI